MYKQLVLAAAITGTLLTTGCAGFKANKLPTVNAQELQFSAPQKTKVFSRWNVETKSKLANEQMKAAGAAIHKKHFEDAIKQSGCCVLVEGPTEADVIVDGRSINENNPAAMIPAMITGLSLFTIPSWVTAKVHIAAEAKSGATIRSYDLQDSMTMVQWLPMVLAMPFADNPIKAGKQVDENTYKNLVLSMKKDGLLK